MLPGAIIIWILQHAITALRNFVHTRLVQEGPCDMPWWGANMPTATHTSNEPGVRAHTVYLY
jgi:hypothetical protein